MLTKRQLKLVNILEKSDDYQTVAFLANSLGVSERTLHTELKFLEDSGVELKKKRGSGVKIIAQDIKYNDLSNPELPDVLKRRIDIMKRLVFNDEHMTFAGLSEEYFTSTTSIQNDIHIIENILFKGTNASLISNHLGTSLSKCSTEQLIKVMVNFNTFIITETSNYIILGEDNGIDRLSDYYSDDIISVCKNILYSFVRENIDTISDIYVESFLHYLIVLVYQVKHDRHIHFNEKSKNHYQHSKSIDDATHMLHKASLRLKFDYTNDDIQYLALLLLNYRFERTPQELLDDELIHNIINQASQAMNIDFIKDKELFQKLKKHVPIMILRLKYQTAAKNPFTEQIKLEYSITYNTLWMIVDSLLQNYEIVVTADEIAFLTLYFQLSIEKLGTGRKILVVCPTGIVTSELLINRIKTISHSLDTIEVASISEVVELDLNLYDLILSTVKFDTNIKHVHFVSPLISNGELSHLFSEKRHIQNINPSDNVLCKYVSEDLIFVNNPMKTKEEILNIISNILAERGYVNNCFSDSLLARESLGGTDLPIGVAIPHGKTTEVRKTFVSILKLDKKIRWEEYKVNLVFFVGISEKDIKKTKQIISSVYSIVNNESILNELKKADTIKEVKDIIYGGK